MHVWKWLTDYAAGMQAISALASIPLLLWAGIAARQAATAAMQQASAARAQVAAAKRAAELSERQLQAAQESAAAERVSSEQHLAAARDTAEAERQHSELIRQQLLASLQPMLFFSWANYKVNQPSVFSLENRSAGAVANWIVVSIKHSDDEFSAVPMDTNVIGPDRASLPQGAYTFRDTETSQLKAKYSSHDGRRFETTATVVDGRRFLQFYREVPDEVDF